MLVMFVGVSIPIHDTLTYLDYRAILYTNATL